MSFFETLMESSEHLAFEKVLKEANVVRMDKATLRRRLLTQATLLAAKDANDPLYQKYVKAAKAKRHFRKLIQQKYEAKGRVKVREFLKAHQMDGKKSK